ncbi:ammonium transporter [Lichtheimia hyalospora FSU 10163]|nr:ammonium transporter [Lichtheimia hyalospora FSU 10163]
MDKEYTIDAGNTAWVMMCAALVFLMTPALGLFYAGLAQAKNALSLMYLTMLCVAVVSFQWYIIGYSLTFSPNAGPFIGDSTHFLLRGVGVAPAFEGQTIPAMVYMIFQAMFACLTPALAFGAAAERMSLGPSIIFIFVWSTLVYDVVTCWIWNPNGWLYKMGAMDYAGGATVHASSGLAAVAYAMLLGKRRHLQEQTHPTPHNVSYMYIGLAFLWFGWFAFNAGSGLAADARAANSFVASHLAACVGAVVWIMIDWLYTRKWSVVGLTTGVIAGLATITPGSGFVSPSSALLFGLLGSIACNYAVRYKHKYGFDDALDVFTVHYVGGLVGLLLTGIFAERYIIGLGSPPGTPEDEIQIGGWLDGHWMQVPIQLAMIAAVSGWSFIVTYIMLLIIDKIPSMQLRLHHEDERIGTDRAQMGETAYGYVEWGEEMRRINSHVTDGAAASLYSVRRFDPFSFAKRIFGRREQSTTVVGAPTLTEEAVLDYGQAKNLGSIPLAKMPPPPPPSSSSMNQWHQHKQQQYAHLHTDQSGDNSGQSSSSSSSNNQSNNHNSDSDPTTLAPVSSSTSSSPQSLQVSLNDNASASRSTPSLAIEEISIGGTVQGTENGIIVHDYAYAGESDNNHDSKSKDDNVDGDRKQNSQA